jgi:hypothetical protein
MSRGLRRKSRPRGFLFYWDVLDNLFVRKVAQTQLAAPMKIHAPASKPSPLTNMPLQFGVTNEPRTAQSARVCEAEPGTVCEPVAKEFCVLSKRTRLQRARRIEPSRPFRCLAVDATNYRVLL